MSLDRLYTAQEIRLMDRTLIVDYGIPGLTLMARAADAAVATILEAFPEASRFCVLCGSGNNAGDGYLVASKLASKGHDVTLVQVGDIDKLGPDARSARAHCL
ncbi:MAG: NAD(P)H-hydrate epimerase, partial [Pseudomonadales bacterium]